MTPSATWCEAASLAEDDHQPTTRDMDKRSATSDLRQATCDQRTRARHLQNSHYTRKENYRMASKKYGKKASDKVEKAMHERKRGTLKSGSSGKKVKSRKQAIAIGLSEARRAGGKVPAKKSSKKSSKKSTKKSTSKKSTKKSTKKSSKKSSKKSR